MKSSFFVSSLLFASLLFTLQAEAHLKLGVYQGLDQDGMACALEIKDISFLGGKKHPLNERVQVVFRSETWELSHPPVIDRKAGSVNFNHDQLVQTVANSTGASALTLNIDHNPANEGPSEFQFIADNWKDDAGDVTFSCFGLKLNP